MLSAEGPKNVALAAQVCDGWLPIFDSPRLAPVYNEWLDEGFARTAARRCRAVVDDVTRLFQGGLKDGADTAITDELVDEAAIVGDAHYVRRQMAAWESAGVTMMVVNARTVEQIRELAAIA